MKLKWIGRIGMGVFLFIGLFKMIDGDTAGAQLAMVTGMVAFLAFEKMDEIDRGKKASQ